MGDVIRPEFNTKAHVPPAQVLHEATRADLASVLVVGFTRHGDLYLAGSEGAAVSAWLAVKAQHEFAQMEPGI